MITLRRDAHSLSLVRQPEHGRHGLIADAWESEEVTPARGWEESVPRVSSHRPGLYNYRDENFRLLGHDPRVEAFLKPVRGAVASDVECLVTSA